MDIQNSYRKIIEIMKNILEEIAARTRERIAKEKSCIFVSELENRIQEVNKNNRRDLYFLLTEMTTFANVCINESRIKKNV